jgi:pyruvate dehydrogenase complex dehydrogenase (E1) component
VTIGLLWQQTASRLNSGDCSHRLHETVTDEIRLFVPDTYNVLGADGFGHSDYRKKLRHQLSQARGTKDGRKAAP